MSGKVNERAVDANIAPSQQRGEQRECVSGESLIHERLLTLSQRLFLYAWFEQVAHFGSRSGVTTGLS